MTRAGTLSLPLVRALRASEGRCYRHCDQGVRARTAATPLPGVFQVLACPSGVVSVAMYSEWSRRDASRSVAAFLRTRTRPASLVRATDLRLATRHGPELGPRAERLLERDPRRRPVRVVYWRVYPFQDAKGVDQRLFVCHRRAHTSPLFYAAPSEGGERACPGCAARAPRSSGARRRTAPQRARPS